MKLWKAKTTIKADFSFINSLIFRNHTDYDLVDAVDAIALKSLSGDIFDFYRNNPLEDPDEYKYTKLYKKSITLITLPTPKQEKLALYLSKKYTNYKIICIGASVAIASGEEKQVPDIFKNYEFLWRLRNDFFRRSKRIIETFVYYLKGRYINKIFHKMRFVKID